MPSTSDEDLNLHRTQEASNLFKKGSSTKRSDVPQRREFALIEFGLFEDSRANTIFRAWGGIGREDEAIVNCVDFA